MQISPEARNIIGIIMITLPTIEFGGVFLLSLMRRAVGGDSPTPAQRAFYRAGHAHAGVLVLLSILAQLLIDVVGAIPLVGLLRIGFFLPPILISAGFFAGAPNKEGKPSGLIALVYLGALILAVSALYLGVSLVFG